MSDVDEPLRTAGVLAVLDSAWWIAGGWAIDLALGRSTREHSDVDIAILRRDQLAVRDNLGPVWSFQVALPGGSNPLRSWEIGERLSPPLHEIHAQHPDGARIELLLQELSGKEWVYRRDSRIRIPLGRIGSHVKDVPVLAPEIVLLYKAKAPRQHDVADLEVALPILSPERLSWLRSAIQQAHPQSRFLDLILSAEDRPAS